MCVHVHTPVLCELSKLTWLEMVLAAAVTWWCEMVQAGDRVCAFYRVPMGMSFHWPASFYTTGGQFSCIDSCCNRVHSSASKDFAIPIRFGLCLQ